MLSTQVGRSARKWCNRWRKIELQHTKNLECNTSPGIVVSCCCCCCRWHQRQSHTGVTSSSARKSPLRRAVCLTVAAAAHCCSNLLQAHTHTGAMPQACCSGGCQTAPVTVAALPTASKTLAVSAAVWLQAMAVCAALRPLQASYTAPALSAGPTQPRAATAAAGGTPVTNQRLPSCTQGAAADAFTHPLTVHTLCLARSCCAATRHAGKPSTTQ